MLCNSRNFWITSTCLMSIITIALIFYCCVENHTRYQTHNTTCTKQPKDLRNLTSMELRRFFDSFDVVITDIDGVLNQQFKYTPTTFETLNKLKNNGKSIIFVTNNGIVSREHYVRNFKSMGYITTIDHIVSPVTTLVWYLKKIKFTKKAFVIGSNYLRQTLMNNNIDIVTGLEHIDENMPLNKSMIDIDEDIKAVIVDSDFNINWAKVAEAGVYLENKDILFLFGSMDKVVPHSNHMIIAAGRLADVLIHHSGRTPLYFAKPGNLTKNYIYKRFVPSDPKRVLFIGDTIDIDMNFAHLCGFQKLWVGSGVDGSDISKVHYDCDSTPDYYLPHIRDMLFVNVTK